MSKARILSAKRAKPQADTLSARLGQRGDVVILLVSAELEIDPRKNDIARQSLEALAQNKLVIVQIDDSTPPLGLRDVECHRWSPAAPDSEEQIGKITAAVRAAKARASARAPTKVKWTLNVFWLLLGLVVAPMVAYQLWSRFAYTSRDSQLRGPGVEGPSTAILNPSPSIGALDLAPVSQGLESVQAMLTALLALQVATLLTSLIRWWFSVRRRRRINAPESFANSTGQIGGLLFASYSRQDHDKVDAMIGDIEREGLPVWLDRVNIGGGATWPEAIVQAIRGARAIIVFCSPHAFQSDNVLREVNLAAEYKKIILPVVLEPVQVPDSFHYYLSTRQIIDASSDPNWRTKVLDALKRAA